MDSRPALSLADELAAARQWWRDAGVDYDYTDATAAWLRDEAPAAAAGEAPPAPVAVAPPPKKMRPAIGGPPESWPAAFEAFAGWWLAEPSLGLGGARPRIPPRGVRGAKLMVLVPEPEAEDRDTLLAGPRGRLLASFLSAAGIGAEETYLAAALPSHAPHPDWAGLARDGLGAVTLHHLALAAPERLLVFGQDILPLLGHDPAQTASHLREINHQGGTTPVLGARSLDYLLARPQARSGFWQRWLDWTGD